MDAVSIRNATSQDADGLTNLLLQLGFPDFAELTRDEVQRVG